MNDYPELLWCCNVITATPRLVNSPSTFGVWFRRKHWGIHKNDSCEVKADVSLQGQSRPKGSLTTVILLRDQQPDRPSYPGL